MCSADLGSDGHSTSREAKDARWVTREVKPTERTVQRRLAGVHSRSSNPSQPIGQTNV